MLGGYSAMGNEAEGGSIGGDGVVVMKIGAANSNIIYQRVILLWS